MSTPPPLPFRWNGAAFVPRNLTVAQAHFERGGVYLLIVHDERSQASHNEYFAALEIRWQTLPESLAAEYPSRESLRHKALIRTGYCTEKDFVLETNRAAQKFAAALVEADDENYCIIDVRGRVVRRYRAMSQSYRNMGKKDFESSKSAVLDWIDQHLLGVESRRT